MDSSVSINPSDPNLGDKVSTAKSFLKSVQVKVKTAELRKTSEEYIIGRGDPGDLGIEELGLTGGDEEETFSSRLYDDTPTLKSFGLRDLGTSKGGATKSPSPTIKSKKTYTSRARKGKLDKEKPKTKGAVSRKFVGTLGREKADSGVNAILEQADGHVDFSDPEQVAAHILNQMYFIFQRDEGDNEPWKMPWVELRPEKIKLGGEYKDTGAPLTLAHVLTEKDKRGRVRLNQDAMDAYIQGFLGKKRIQVHLPDLLIDPKTEDIDWFSITTGDVEKVGWLYADMAEYLARINKSEHYDYEPGRPYNDTIVIQAHLTNCEVYKRYDGKKIKGGGLNAKAKRAAMRGADDILLFLENQFAKRRIKDVIIGLETGPGEMRNKRGELMYAIMNDPQYFQVLLEGREGFAGCLIDVAHLEFSKRVDHSLFLSTPIAEYHVSGNRKNEEGLPVGDEHIPATPHTLSCFQEIVTLAKITAPSIGYCAETQRKDLDAIEYAQQLLNFFEMSAQAIAKPDHSNWQRMHKRIKDYHLQVWEPNLDKKRFKELMKYAA